MSSKIIIKKAGVDRVTYLLQKRKCWGSKDSLERGDDIREHGKGCRSGRKHEYLEKCLR